GVGTLSEPVRLTARDTTPVKLKADLFVPALSTLPPHLLAKDSVALDVESRFELKVGVATVPLQRRTRLAFSPRALLRQSFAEQIENQRAFRIRGFKPGLSADLKTTRLDVELEWFNDHGFDYVLENLRLDLFVAGECVGRWQSDRPETLRVQSRTPMHMNFFLDNARAIGAMVGVLGGQKPKIRLRGSAAFAVAGNRVELPLDIELQP
ncbi:MAG: hypothetical protein RMM53_12045, partial [Bacteroidia bacterium]|nr:hypothetical protein [Bacteroidia bacterium]